MMNVGVYEKTSIIVLLFLDGDWVVTRLRLLT